MKTGMVAVIAVVGALLASSVVYAGWGGGWCMTGNGQNVSTQKMRNFQKDTLKLRENLMEKQLDLQDELSMDVPDGKKVAALRKEIINLQSQLQAAGTKYGMTDWGMGSGSGNRNMMNYGCGCGMCGW
jgi:Spy/CpxP family protein refolding chaperone